MEEKIFTLATPPIKIFKSIRFRKLYYDDRGKTKQVVGHLNYLRFASKQYKWQIGDELDALILRAAKAAFIDADFVYNRPLILENQLKDCKHVTRGNVRQPVLINFLPNIEFTLATAKEGDVIKTYMGKFYLNVQTLASIGKSITETQPIDVFDVRLPKSSLDRLVKTIEPV